jgi:Transglutaminase-like superfamily
MSVTGLARPSRLSALLEVLRVARGHMSFRGRAESARVQELFDGARGSSEVTRQHWALRVWHRLYSRSSDACLERSLQLAVILRRQGREADVVIGFRPGPDGRLLAHAWVEGVGVPCDAAGHVPVLLLKMVSGGDGADLREAPVGVGEIRAAGRFT